MMLLLSFWLIGVLGIPQLYVDPKSNSFGDFALGAGFDINRFEPMTQHVFREFGTDTGVTYDFMPVTSSKTRCGFVRSSEDVTEELFVRGELSVEYKAMSGSGFIEFDQKEERMRHKMYFNCIVDRGLFTISINPPQIHEGTSDEQLDNMLPTNLRSIIDPKVFAQEAGEYHVRSITYGRRYQTEVSMSYSNDESYERIAGEIEAEYGMGFLTIAAKINLEMIEDSSQSDMRMSASSESYGFIQSKALFLPTEVDEDGNAPFVQMQKMIEENLEAFNILDSNGMQAKRGISGEELFELVGDAYPLYYTVARNAPYYEVLSPLTAIQESDMVANVDEAYDILRELKELHDDIDNRAELLFQNYHLLSGSDELSLRFLDIRQGLMDRIIELQTELKEYLGQYPIELAEKSVYVWAYTHEEGKELKHTSLEIIRSDVWKLMGMEDVSMQTDPGTIGAKCIFNGIQADYQSTPEAEPERMKFAGRVVFGDKVVRHVVFDADGRVQSLGFIDHSLEAVSSVPDLSNHPLGLNIDTNAPHELVYVRADCTFLRVSTPVWYLGSRYVISEIGSADHKTPHGYVNKEKLTSIRIKLIPVDSTQDVTFVLTGEEIDDVSLRGAPNSDHFTLDNQSRLMYKSGYVCDWGFGSKEAKMICSTLGYSNMEKFETNTVIPTGNAWSRPHITMYNLDCNLYALALDCDNCCTYDVDPMNINWDQCGAANGVELICTDYVPDFDAQDVEVEITSSNNEGCTLNENDVSGAQNDAGLINTNEHCLGGEDENDVFGAVDDVSVFGDVCLKFFSNDQIQCVFPAGAFQFCNGNDNCQELENDAQERCYADYDHTAFPQNIEVIYDSVPLVDGASGPALVTYTISARLLEYVNQPTSAFPVELKITSGEETHTIMVDSVDESFTMTVSVRCAYQFHVELIPTIATDECHFVGERPVDTNGDAIVDGDVEIQFACSYTEPDTYEVLGTGYCKDDNGNYPDYYKKQPFTGDEEECKDLCNQAVECIAIDMPLIDMCRLWVPNGLELPSTLSMGWSFYPAGLATTVTTAKEDSTWFLGCSKKILPELSVGAEMTPTSLAMQMQFDSRWMRVLAIIGLGSVILNFYSRCQMKANIYESIDVDCEV